MLFEKKAKSCTEVLDSGLQLKVWGIQTSRRLLSEIVGDKDNYYWGKWTTINDYCLYVIISNENGGLTDAEKKYCNELSLLLEKEVKKMRSSIHSNSVSNDLDCKKILALERAILTLQTRLKKQAH